MLVVALFPVVVSCVPWVYSVGVLVVVVYSCILSGSP